MRKPDSPESRQAGNELQKIHNGRKAPHVYLGSKLAVDTEGLARLSRHEAEIFRRVERTLIELERVRNLKRTQFLLTSSKRRDNKRAPERRTSGQAARPSFRSRRPSPSGPADDRGWTVRHPRAIAQLGERSDRHPGGPPGVSQVDAKNVGGKPKSPLNCRGRT